MCARKSWCCGCHKSLSTSSHKDPIPVDRGWAWVIVLASAGLFCLITGTFKCFGILKIEIQLNFQECNEDVILWILSACSIVSLLSGVGFSWLVSKTSHRTIGLIGGSLCSLGIFLTAFSPNCYFMFLSLGVIYSTGAGGVMVVVFSAFADYFSVHRGLAVGIVASGSGLGSLTVPKLLSYLFELYSFRDALMCYAGVFLQSLFFAALLRPSSYYNNGSDSTHSENDEHICEDQEDDEKDEEIFLSDIAVRDELTDDCNSPLRSSSAETMLADESSRSLNTSQPTLLLGNNNKLTLPNNAMPECGQLYGSVYSSLAGPFLSTLTLNDLENTNKQEATASSNATTETSSSFGNVGSYNWALWCNSQVLMIGALVFFAVNGVNLIFTTTPSFAREHGVNVELVANIISFTGLGEIVCRMVHGWFADRRIFSALTQICLIMLACTAGALLCAFIHGLVGIAIMYTVMSLCGTTIYSLLPIVIIEQIGKESLVTVLGIFYVYQATAFVVSTVVANALHSITDTWQYVFYYISACYFTALLIGVVSFVLYRLKLRRRKVNNHVVAALC